MRNVKNADFRMVYSSAKILVVQMNMMGHLGMVDFVQNFVGEVFVEKRQ